ncbi:MAG: family 3 adenylate cyclase [Acidobacteria bacterium]|nr:family 3 adenylate cyclase [Acidobacteriota bacterium]
MDTLGNGNTRGDQPARLIVTTADKPAAEIVLGDLLTIGRSPDNDLVLEDKRASRNHAEIRRLGGRYRLSDVGSSNGTWIQGRRLTAPRDLEDGDEVLIGAVRLRFLAPDAPPEADPTAATGTVISMRSELVIVLVADIRNYTAMSESLPNSEFSRLISNWFHEASEIIETGGGIIDKYIGDAVMAFWLVSDRSAPAKEVHSALRAAGSLVARAALFSGQFSSQFPGQSFRIGIGMNMGPAMMGNVGTGKNQSFTILGDSVNVAFRLEELSKEKGSAIIVSRNLTEWVLGPWRFRDLGQAEVKGRTEPVSICALEWESGSPS